MRKRYAVLQRKMQELESILIETSSKASETASHKHMWEGIEQRIMFLSNLLAAETASNPSKPHHLHHVAHRLTELETYWDAYRLISPNNNFDAASTCSCTVSCLYDDGEAEALLEQQVDVMPGENNEEVVPMLLSSKNERGGTGRAEKVGGLDWQYWVVVGCGMMIVGAVLMWFVMARFCGCFDYYVTSSEKNIGLHLTPT